MIVRRGPGGWILFRQHDHGRAAGEIAAAWDLRGPTAAETVLATASHDVAWEALDDPVRWETGGGRPLSFLDGPVAPRLEAYRRGIDLVEAASGGAAWRESCSAPPPSRGSPSPSASPAPRPAPR